MCMACRLRNHQQMRRGEVRERERETRQMFGRAKQTDAMSLCRRCSQNNWRPISAHMKMKRCQRLWLSVCIFITSPFVETLDQSSEVRGDGRATLRPQVNNPFAARTLLSGRSRHRLTDSLRRDWNFVNYDSFFSLSVIQSELGQLTVVRDKRGRWNIAPVHQK